MPSKGQRIYPLERRPIFILSLLLSFIVIFGVASIVAYQAYTKAIDASVRSNETRASLLAKLILEHQRAAIGVLQSYADRPLFVDSVKRRNFEGALYHLTDLAKNNPEMDWPFLANPDSTVWVNYPVDTRVMNKDLSYRDWYKGVSKEWKPYISSVYKLIVGEKDLAVAVCTPLLDEKGKVIGILSTAQSTAFFRKIIGEFGSNLDAKTTLIDQGGHIIYSNGFPYTKEVIGYPPLEFVGKALRGEKGDAEVHDVSDQDRIKYVSFAPIEGIGWSVIVEKARNEVLRSEASHLALIGVIALLIYGFAVLSLLRFRERHRQLKELVQLNEELEDRVRERTAELEAGNKVLQVSEQRWATTLSSIGDAVIATDLSGKITFINKIAEELTGWTVSEATSKPVGDVFHIINEHTRKRVEDPVAKVLKEGVIVGLASHTVLVGKTGIEIPIDDSGAPIRVRDGKLIGVVLVFRDITERKRAEEALQQRTLKLQHLVETLEDRVNERTAELANLSSQLVSAQEDERRRVSYDLHDNVWQMLLAIRTEIDQLFLNRDGMDWAAYQEKSKRVMTAILEAVGKIRSMQGDLWPYVLDDIGIMATIDWYCREFEKSHSSLTIEKTNGITEAEVPSSAKIVIYRILQETLSNVAKHSLASHVTIRLVKRDQGIEFTVEDNGIGFDPEETIAKNAPWGGLGLLSIKARIELSGGTFGVESAKGKGTTVRASWPL